VRVSKRIILQSPLNEVREAEVTLGVELTWQNPHTGQILASNVPVQPADAPPLPADEPDPSAPPVAPPAPVLVQRTAPFIPELGESLASARKAAIDDLAEQIVSMLETPW
jgi:hypothetical protein